MRALVGMISLFLVPAFNLRAAAPETASVVVVVGAAGEEEYGTNFVQQATLWTQAAEKAGATAVTIGLDPQSATTDLEQLRTRLAAEPTEGTGDLWLVLIGHGTFDGKEARFNLRGPDLTAAELADWMKPFRRPVAVINTASSSAPFLNALSRTNRVVITATRSGSEQNVTRFGLPLAQALSDPASDLDHDGQTSLLEAFLSASRRASEFYQTAGRLPTEHALLDDNGDSLGTPADWFRGVRATKQARDGASLDGSRAQQFVLLRSPAEEALGPAIRARRDELEREMEVLRGRKAKMPPDEYYRALELLLLDLARLYEPPATTHR